MRLYQSRGMIEAPSFQAGRSLALIIVIIEREQYVSNHLKHCPAD